MKSNTRTPDGWDIDLKIVDYLEHNPDAQDTLEGIVEWWFLEQDLRHHIPRVEAALERLIKKGLLETTQGAYSRIRYRINAVRREEIRIAVRPDRGQ